MKEKKAALSQSLQGLTKIYLDTKFWLLLRDAYLGRERYAGQNKLLQRLLQLWEDRLIICPISEDIFIEIIRQTDEKTLITSIELIDKLSNGVTLISNEERWQTEIFHFVRSYSHFTNSIYRLNELVWIKLAYLQGVKSPNIEELSPETNNSLQKSFLDHMWSVSLVDIYKTVGIEGFGKYPHMPDISDFINNEKINYHNKKLSFKEMFLSEVALLLDSRKNYFDELFVYIYTKQFGKRPASEEIANSDAAQKFANLVYHAFRLGKVGNQLATFDVEAGINAQILYDRKRKYKRNDFYDINHAVAALPYCDMFLTEKNLKSFVTRKNLKYDKKYGCKVLSGIEESIYELEGII